MRRIIAPDPVLSVVTGRRDHDQLGFENDDEKLTAVAARFATAAWHRASQRSTAIVQIAPAPIAVAREPRVAGLSAPAISPGEVNSACERPLFAKAIVHPRIRCVCTYSVAHGHR